MSSRFKLDLIQASTKQIGADVANLRIKMDQVIKEGIKLANKIRTCTDELSGTLTTQCTALKYATANTIVYLFRRAQKEQA